MATVGSGYLTLTGDIGALHATLVILGAITAILIVTAGLCVRLLRTSPSPASARAVSLPPVSTPRLDPTTPPLEPALASTSTTLDSAAPCLDSTTPTLDELPEGDAESDLGMIPLPM